MEDPTGHILEIKCLLESFEDALELWEHRLEAVEKRIYAKLEIEEPSQWEGMKKSKQEQKIDDKIESMI